ncbi:hypothetical protein BSK25_13755 [Klebsiella pneumoniae]|nr:hypothetical protein BSK25_13755 [Klebsiella pneumoniae]HBX5241255.1 hypothetical protein [Klebsiella pneumoniae]
MGIMSNYYEILITFRNSTFMSMETVISCVHLTLCVNLLRSITAFYYMGRTDGCNHGLSIARHTHLSPQPGSRGESVAVAG